MPSDYISREAIGLTDFEIILCQADENKYKSALVMLLEKIEKLPAADVREVKKGRWKNAEPNFMAKCSNCQRYYISRDEKYEFHFCPNCGAQMDMGEEQT